MRSERSNEVERVLLTEQEPKLWWPRQRHRYREQLAEFCGVFIMILFGDGVVAQVMLSQGTKGDYQSISWGWGLGVMLGVYTAGISGAHLNPAVTLTNCVFRGFPWRKFPSYILAQTLGAFLASGVVYANYRIPISQYRDRKALRDIESSLPNPTANIFSTYPVESLSTPAQFFSEFNASAILMFCIFALQDEGNLGAGNLTPLGLFFVVFGIGCAWGWETGYAVNLARDFGPRLMSYALGYGDGVWTAGGYYFWVPMIAPFCGMLFGGLMYDIFLFTGKSPINTPGMGLKGILRPGDRRGAGQSQAMP